jgi:hypothetical protein
MMDGVDHEEQFRYAAAKQVVVNVAAGLAGYWGPGAGALAVGVAPEVLGSSNDIEPANYGNTKIRLRRV